MKAIYYVLQYGDYTNEEFSFAALDFRTSDHYRAYLRDACLFAGQKNAEIYADEHPEGMFKVLQVDMEIKETTQ